MKEKTREEMILDYSTPGTIFEPFKQLAQYMEIKK